MFKIALKNFKGNIRNFWAFFTSTIVTISILFLMSYVGEAVSHIERDAVFFNQGISELKQIMWILNPLLVGIGVIVIAYSVQFYIYSRMKDYGMLKILGIRRRDMNKMLIIEYGMGCCFSCVFGLVVGKILSFCLGKRLENVLDERLIRQINMENVYKYTLLLCVAMIILSLFAISIILSEKEVSDIIKGDVIKEKRMVSPRAFLFSMIGVCIILLSIVLTSRYQDLVVQKYLLMLMSIGFAVSLLLGAGVLFERYRAGKGYLKKILVWNEFYHYFNSNKYMILIQTMIGICIIYFSFLFAPALFNQQEAKFPNDFLCISEEKTELEKEMLKKYMQSGEVFPFIYVYPFAAEGRIGISETEYNRLFHQKIDLQDNEIISICDNSNGLANRIKDEEMNGQSQLLHLGGEKEGIRKEDGRFFVKDETDDEVLGFGFGGMIIFSDKTFEKAFAEEKYPKKMLLCDAKKDMLASATEYVENEKGKQFMKIFAKKTAMDNERREMVLEMTIFGVVILAILFYSMFVLWLRNFSNLERLKDKYEFLSVLGMREKERRRLLKKELGKPIWLENICVVILGGSFCAAKIWGLTHQGSLLRSIQAGKELYIVLFMLLVSYVVIRYMFLMILRIWTAKKIFRS